MNYRIITYVIGWVLNLEAICMALPAVTGLIYGEKTWTSFLITGLISALAGTLLVGKTTLFYERGMCIGSSFLDRAQSDWFVTFYDQWDDSAFCGCSFRDGLRFYNNGSKHYGIGGRCTTLYPDVEKLYPLDRWYGCPGIIAFYY